MLFEINIVLSFVKWTGYILFIWEHISTILTNSQYPQSQIITNSDSFKEAEPIEGPNWTVL